MKLPSIFSQLRPAIPRFKASVPVLIALLWCFALFWVWWYGPKWEVVEIKPLETSVSRWLVTALLVLIALSVLTWRIMKKLRQLELMQLKSAKEENDPVSTDINYQDSYLSHWLIKLQQHLNTPSFLYRLPWYLIIGSEQSGKTTLLKESCKLTTLYTPEMLKGEESAKLMLNCWVGEQAIIFDPNGKLITQPDYGNTDKPQLFQRLWNHLFDWLNEHRRRQPLNGIIVTVDIHQLLTFTKEQRETYTATLQQRLHDIGQMTHSHLPVYIILTKLDRLYGFEAMYQTLDKNQRDQILGTTFSLNSLNPDSWHAELETFWQQWMTQLNGALPDMMLNDVDVGQRSQLFSFTRQMQGARTAIEQLVEDVLFNGDQERHMLRGIYLTSAQQRGQMDDLFVQSAAAQYRLGSQAYPTWQSGKTFPFFTKALFSKVIFAEPNLASENTAWLKNSKQKIMIFSCIGAACALALLGGWHYYYNQNYQAGQKVLVQARTFLDIPPPVGSDFYGDLQLPLLNPIREATLAYGNYRDRNRVFADLGLYQGYRIGPYVESTYLQLLEQRYLPALMDGLLDKLKKAPSNSEEKLEILRIMRMLDDASGRNKPVVEQYMRDRWSTQFTGQRIIQEQLMGHLDYALQHTDWNKERLNNDQAAIKSYVPYAQPIKEAQIELSKLPIYQRVYQNLKVKALEVLPPDLNMRDQVGASFDSIFVASDEKLLFIPQFLTRNGLVNYFVKQNDHLVELTAMDSWVLNLSKNIQYSEADRQEIQRKITELYLSDYTATWRAAINNLEVMPFNDMPQAIAGIEQVISGEQPFRRALQTLRDNSYTPVLPADVKGKELEESMNQPVYKLLVNINRTFSPQTSTLTENGEQTSILQGVYQKLTDLHRYLLAIQNSPVPGKAALKAVQLRLDQNSSDPIFEVQQLAKNLPEPLNRWVGGLAEQAWRVVMMEAIHSLELEWNEKVVKQYQTYLAGRYPFDPSSKQDVPLSEFERFFAPNGTIDSFYQQNLKQFVENNLASGAEGQTLIREDVLQQLALAKKIRETFFNAQNGLGTQFAIEPFELSANKRRSVLNLDGQLMDYTHGRSSLVHLVWPNSMREGVESKFTLVPNEANKSPRSKAFTGPWAQLRLINSGQLTNVKNGSFDVRFEIDGGYMTYRIHVDEADNPFAGGLFSRFVLPETLY